MPAVLTYLTVIPNSQTGGNPLRAGDRVLLRPAAKALDIEAWAECGRWLGRLPPVERNMLASLGFGSQVMARVTAVLPRPELPQASRLLLQVDAA